MIRNENTLSATLETRTNGQEVWKVRKEQAGVAIDDKIGSPVSVIDPSYTEVINLPAAERAYLSCRSEDDRLAKTTAEITYNDDKELEARDFHRDITNFYAVDDVVKKAAIIKEIIGRLLALVDLESYLKLLGYDVWKDIQTIHGHYLASVTPYELIDINTWYGVAMAAIIKKIAAYSCSPVNDAHLVGNFILTIRWAAKMALQKWVRTFLSITCHEGEYLVAIASKSLDIFASDMIALERIYMSMSPKWRKNTGNNPTAFIFRLRSKLSDVYETTRVTRLGDPVVLGHEGYSFLREDLEKKHGITVSIHQEVDYLISCFNVPHRFLPKPVQSMITIRQQRYFLNEYLWPDRRLAPAAKALKAAGVAGMPAKAAKAQHFATPDDITAIEAAIKWFLDKPHKTVIDDAIEYFFENR